MAVEPDFASGVQMRCVAVEASTGNALIGTRRLFNLSARSELLKLLFGPLHALVERLERRLDVLALLFEILDLLAGLLERQLELRR
jgi:hypothetical protein